MVKRRLTCKQPAPPEYCYAVKRRKLTLPENELVSMVRVILRNGGLLSGRARAFSYAVLSCNPKYDVGALSQLPHQLLHAVLDLLLNGAQNPHHFQGDHRVPAQLPSNMVEKTLQSSRAYQVRFMLADLKVESSWTFSYPQAIEWHRVLSAMKTSASDRMEKHKKNTDLIPPIAFDELMEALVNSPSLDLTFTTLVSSTKTKRVSASYTNNYWLAMQQWVELKELVASCKHRKQKDIDVAISDFKKQALLMVDSEKTALARRERHLIAAVSAAIQLANVKVGQQLQQLIGLDKLDISPEEVVERLQEAPPITITRLQSTVFACLPGARRLKDSALKVVNDKRKEKGAAPSPLFNQGSALLPQILSFLSLKQVISCRRVCMNFLEASNLDFRQRLSKFVYSADFLNGISQTRSGRRLSTRVETQVRHLRGLLSTPCFSKFFEELNLQNAPKEAISANNIAPCLARMVSLRTVVLHYEGKEWAHMELSRICKALPQGASMESYNADGKQMTQFVQGSPTYRLR